jgi:hypothetical protein
MSAHTTLGIILGQGRSADEILTLSTIEKAGSLRKGTIIEEISTLQSKCNAEKDPKREGIFLHYFLSCKARADHIPS